MKMWGGQEEMINCKINIDEYYASIVQCVLQKDSTKNEGTKRIDIKMDNMIYPLWYYLSYA